MKTLKEISIEIGVSISTLHKRIKIYSLEPISVKHRNGFITFYLNENEEEIIKIKHVFRPCERLIKEAIFNHPDLSDDELALMLAIDKKHINRDCFVLESKMNY